jgi:hypothetical protein
MVIRKEGENIVIYPIWRGDPDLHIPEDSPKIIISHPNQKKLKAAGIKIIGYENYFMNSAAAKELSEALQKAIELTSKMDSERSSTPPRYIVKYKHPSGTAKTASVIFACAEVLHMKEEIQVLQTLSDSEHLQNILKILRFDFWSDDERLFFIWMYTKMIIEKMIWDDRPYEDKLIKRLLEIVNE